MSLWFICERSTLAPRSRSRDEIGRGSGAGRQGLQGLKKRTGGRRGREYEASEEEEGMKRDKKGNKGGGKESAGGESRDICKK